MDLNKVYMVRSAKGVDMLCVDDFLYHFDGRGRSNTYRWLCNRRKDKHTPCRSRISTVLANPRDRSVHIVHEVCSEHTHPRCSAHEITKVSERKRLANLQGLPCTLDLKRKRLATPLDPRNSPSQKRPLLARSIRPSQGKQLRGAQNEQENFSCHGIIDFEDKDRVHILRRLDGRIMCCVDGQLYYLESKSAKMDVFLWSCVRKRDVSCTAVVYTEPTIEGTHRLRPMDADWHIHAHYSSAKLEHMFAKHNITVVDEELVEEMLDECDVELFDDSLESGVLSENTNAETEMYVDEEEEPIIIEDFSDDYEVLIEENVVHANPLTGTTSTSAGMSWPSAYDVIENHITPDDYDPLTEKDFSKFTFLPTAKGKKVLCVNRCLYHFDSQSKANGHMFWTCINRRVKRFNCHVRVVMDPGAENGPVILRITGQHTHPVNTLDIAKRIRRQSRQLNANNGEEFFDEDEEEEENEDDDDDDDGDGVGDDDAEEDEDYDGNEDEDVVVAPDDEESEWLANEQYINEDKYIVEDDHERYTTEEGQMKKLINSDDIKVEPNVSNNTHHTSANPAMIVEYLNDGSDNISAKIEILPTALETPTVVGDDGAQALGTNSKVKMHAIKKASTAEFQASRPTTRRSTANATKHSMATRTKAAAKAATPSPKAGSTANSSVEPDMDLTRICKLRSAKGSELLCVDGYIYNAKNKGLISRSYWVCIKARDPEILCKSRVSTAPQKDGSIRVLRVYNQHSHPVSETDIKRRLYNEINKKNNKKLKFRPLHFIEKSLDEINAEYGDLTIERLKVSNISQDVLVHKPPRFSSVRITPDDEDDEHSPQRRPRRKQSQVSPHSIPQQRLTQTTARGRTRSARLDEVDDCLLEQEMDDYADDYGVTETEILNTTEEDSIIEEVGEVVEYQDIEPIYSMKLYAVSDGPPSLAVRMTLRALNIDYQLINVDFVALEHRSEEYAKMNPQKEIPVLDDDGFYLSESVAIMQYLCDKYAHDSTLYPADANLRALINQRLCFNMGFYYAPIGAHSMAPIFFDYERTETSLKKVQNALDVFETYLRLTGTKYSASDNVTIADFALVSATLCLEAIGFDLSPYARVAQWYETFKLEYPELWEIANAGMQEIAEFDKNPPDLSHVVHPFHPTRKSKT